MNHAYRLIWQAAARTWVAVAENVRGRGKGSRTAPMLALLLAAGSALAGVDPKVVDPNALPTGYKLIAGESDAPKMVGNEMVIDQKSLRAVYGWDSFDIGADRSVYFKQISSSAVAMNLIGGNEASQIYGRLRADGQLFLMSAPGVVFAPGSQIDVGGMLATTMHMDVDDFMDGNYWLEGAGSGVIRNQGIIRALGSVVLAGNDVSNSGEIIATTVTLAAGDKIAIDLTGDGLIRARVENPALRARLENIGDITATLSVAMTAGDAKSALDSIVNNTGTIRATGLVERGGEILLEGTIVKNDGTLDASSTTGAGGRVDVAAVDIELGSKSVIDVTGTSGGRAMIIGDMKKGRAQIDGVIRAAATGSKATDDGGFVETSAAFLKIAKGFRVNARSAHGRTGNWLIDPLDFYITAGSDSLTESGIGADTLSSNLADANMTVETSGGEGTGNLYVDGVVRWSANMLTLSAHRNIYIRKDLVGSGSAKLTLKYGMDSADGNGADYYLQNGAAVYLPAGNNFTTRSGQMDEAGTTYKVITSLGVENDTSTTTLQGINGGKNGKYALGADIDASATASWNGGAGFTPIGNESVVEMPGTPFTGRFLGLGHTISNLSINRPSTNGVGLFGLASRALIRDVGLIGASVVGASRVGGIAGSFAGGSLRYSYVTGSVRSSGAYNSIGGLIGYLDAWDGLPGLVADSFADVEVTATGSTAVGGLVGRNAGGKILRSSASGGVSGTGDVGGLVGHSDSEATAAGGDSAGAIVDSYATGAVTGNAASARVGGLVGYLSFGSVARSYATGLVSGSGENSLLGGFAGGVEQGAAVTSSFWDTQTSGQTGCSGTGAVANCTGRVSEDMKKYSTYYPAAEWNITDDQRSDATWRITEGQTYPLLASAPVRRSVAASTSDTARTLASSGKLEAAAILVSLPVPPPPIVIPPPPTGGSVGAGGGSGGRQPADDIVAPGGKKGRALVCRGG